MKCSCPHCSAKIDRDLLTVPDDGMHSKCPECGKRFWIQREFFAARALRKRGEIYCAQCWTDLDHTIICPGCRTIYPDFFVVQAKKSVQKRVPATKGSFSLRKPYSSKPRSSDPRAFSPRPGMKMPRSFVKMASVATVLSLVLLGGYFYYQSTLEDEYSRNFVRALYAVKTGKDKSHEARERIISRLKEPGQDYVLRITEEDKAGLNKVKSSADKLMKRIGNPPRKYAKANEKLVKLYDIYSEMNTLTISHPDSPESFKNVSTRLENDFAEGIREMKANLPEKLSERIRTAQARYKNLRDI
jgi:hypothetical protein